MSPGLLFPAALAALAALAIPLGIHLARRSDSRTVLFAALRWLAPKSAALRRRRLEELWLLAVRLALLAVLALFLAHPVLWNVQERRGVLAVAPGLNPAVAAREAGSRRAVWLAPGFPAVTAPAPAPTLVLSSLIRQLDADLPAGAPLELVVPASLDPVDAERLVLSRPVVWRILPDPAAPPRTAAPEQPALVVRYSAGAAERVRWFRAAAIAWAEPGQEPAFAAEPAGSLPPVDGGVLVWLAPGPTPPALEEWVRRGGVALLAQDATLTVAGEASPVWVDAQGAPLATGQALGRGRVLRFTRPLQPAAMPVLVEAGFPAALRRLVQPPPPPARVRAADFAPLPGGAAAASRPLRDLQPWFALLLALLFLLERFLATRARPAAAP